VSRADNDAPGEAVLSIKEAGALLGLGSAAAYASIQRGDFPVRTVMIGKRRKVLRADVERFLAGDVAHATSA
jgi:hypothetical protein